MKKRSKWLDKRSTNKQVKRLTPKRIVPAMITTASPAAVLAEAYPISIYWDSVEELFFLELQAFDVEIHGSPNWGESIALARQSQLLLINAYRMQNLTLPDLA